MNTSHTREFYRALLERDHGYEGVFYVGVRTTGVFCRPTCPARKPKFENCEFFKTAEQALLAAYRPCRRCKPLSHPDVAPDAVRRLVEAVEREPERRWTTADFAELAVDESTARRLFKKRFGMTFVAYARARRLGIAMKAIRAGAPVIEAQLAAGYGSASGFRDAFSRIMGAPPVTKREGHLLKAIWFDARLGPMVAIADDEALYLLEFVDRRGLEREIDDLRRRTRCAVIPGESTPLRMIRDEVNEYFCGDRQHFETPLHLLGSDFQRNVWAALLRIPPGETRSYAQIAREIGAPNAYRAVARANGANRLALVVPCHRVVQSDGSLGGYGGGLARKGWLLDHERSGEAS